MQFAIALALFASLTAQGGQDPLLSRLAGEWSGTGTVLNQPARITMAWTWELDGQFLRLGFRNQMGSAAASVFQGHAYYRPMGEGRYRGMWFDSSGMFRPIDARRDGDALVAEWGAAGTEQGETTYRLLANGRMEVIDRVKSKAGEWREFGRSQLSKQAPAVPFARGEGAPSRRPARAVNRD
jgi:hypothetical protein